MIGNFIVGQINDVTKGLNEEMDKIEEEREG